MPDSTLSRDELAERYLEQLRFELYPVQEEALLAWFSTDQGVLVCTPTGMGKTLIAEAAVFEALHTGQRLYYTTPLIALTEQKFHEMQEAAVRWGFAASDVGLVTGNRRANPDAPVLVVVAEILFNRLLHPELFDFSQVSAVVMDEFHSFADPERGIVWEFTLGLLPQHVRILLLSATVGNAAEFVAWLRRAHDRVVELVQGTERRVPLVFQWVDDKLLPEQLEAMAQGDAQSRLTPALVFCFNREECWTVAEQIKGRKILSDGQQAALAGELRQYDWSQGAGPKLRQLLLRGVGVHHAGVLPRYRRIVEDLFEKKLLSVAMCTETLSAGINLPARSVVLPSLVKGPPEKRRLISPSTAHQIFGRAGRPQYDLRGYVFVLAHEDDVKIARWRARYEQIPDETRDPALLKAKRALKRKMPRRRANEQYWTEEQFNKLRAAPPGKLTSRGPLPWRLLAYMLEASPDVELIRKLVGKRLMDSKRIEAGQRDLDHMLLVLWRAGYVRLEPEPPKQDRPGEDARQEGEPRGAQESFGVGLFDTAPQLRPASPAQKDEERTARSQYKPQYAYPTAELGKLLMLRGVNPLYGVFLVNHLGVANRRERIQAMESVLELPRSIGRFVRVPGPDELPPGPLATTRLDDQLLRLGLVTEEQLRAPTEEEQRERRKMFPEERPRVLTLAEKLRLLFDYDFPGVRDVATYPVWAAGELLEFGGDFNKYIVGKGLQKQEGVIFRHLLRLILLVAEFTRLTPPDTTEAEWRADLGQIARTLTESCRQVDPSSTEQTLQQAELGPEETAGE
ncbi:MAG TPA: DEAD/DEAH box helicase [Planctomycetaceae bacterium]|nr:DEAD/DEAH box helicase [Planctomycetaceae bacterium]